MRMVGGETVGGQTGTDTASGRRDFLLVGRDDAAHEVGGHDIVMVQREVVVTLTGCQRAQLRAVLHHLAERLGRLDDSRLPFLL